MATPARIDGILDDAQLAREDAHGGVLNAQHALHNALTALRAAWDYLQPVECALAGDDGQGDPGQVFVALRDIREEPAWRRAVAAEWDGATERRSDGSLVAL